MDFMEKPPIIFIFKKSIPDFMSEYNGFLEAIL